MSVGKDEQEPVTGDDGRVLGERLEALKREVPIYVFTRKGENEQFNRFTVAAIKALRKLSPKIIPAFHAVGDEVANKYKVDRSPTILIDPEAYRIRYTGSPAGEEMRSLLDTVTMVSLGKSFLSDSSRKRLDELKEERDIRVFVTPT